MQVQLSPEAIRLLNAVRQFVGERILPIESQMIAENKKLNRNMNWQEWKTLPSVESLKQEAKKAGLWNLFLPDVTLGKGLSCSEYAPMAEAMGQSLFAPEIFNCNAPDTGNMEVLFHFGSTQQKQDYLTPLLSGEMRSVFAMTEPDVASSDATNMQTRIEVVHDELIINGSKWWTTGLGHPDAKVAIVMGLSNPENDRHRQHSMVLVPLDAPGVKIERMLSACGEYDAPYGHGQMTLENVRVPQSNLIKGLGEGFAIAQGRLGPGRIHHCMRAIGAAERALKLMIERGSQRVAFGKPIIQLGGNLERIAKARILIDQARLLTQLAAWKIDTKGVKTAMTEISAIKVVVPNMLQEVVDMAIQMHGAAGVSDDFPLAGFAAMARVLRIADGPDEVHLKMVSKLELKKYAK